MLFDTSNEHVLGLSSEKYNSWGRMQQNTALSTADDTDGYLLYAAFILGFYNLNKLGKHQSVQDCLY